MKNTMALSRRILAESVGTAFLLAAVVGSGIMAERLAGGNAAIALLANTIATAGALFALIAMFESISGAHFNPIVTLSVAVRRGLPWNDVPWYVLAQCGGAILGVAVANTMFGLPLFSVSHHERAGIGKVLSESVATFGLVGTIVGCSRGNAAYTPLAVAAYIASAYWFTASTSFANPAVTIARSLSNTFAGIRPSDVGAFIVAQIIGAGAATVVFAWLLPVASEDAVMAAVPSAVAQR